MSNKKPRINVTFEESLAGILASLAKKDNKSIASVVRDLAMDGLAMREDLYLSALAEERDTPSVKRHSHDDAWK